ncbi:MAG TPA: AI-2E family transporter [Cyanobacteria bacterium UBA12227]|nr:AI-2E family transporter [Cyanobacteria bacterium UBA12227]HAX90093.1 AI-2E family transporter [Cyanobacteria bacterium UBA11370]HBY77268.1 AI-2E family transporter [Cyanobacteria bacterium UBA11148]
MREPPATRFLERLNNLLLVRFLLFFASGWALIQLLAYFETVIVTFTFAAVIASLLSYPTRWLERFLPRSIAVGVVVVVSFLTISGLFFTVGLAVLSQGQQLINKIIEFVNSLEPVTKQLEVFLQTQNIPVNLDVLQEPIRDIFLSRLSYIFTTLTSFLVNLIDLILIAVIAFFMLLHRTRLWKFALKIVPKHLRKRFAYNVKTKFVGFFQGQLIVVLFLTVSTFIVFVILQVPFPLILSLIAGILDVIPGIGATLGVGIVFLILLLQNVWLAFKVLVACIILQQIQDNLISPRIMQNSVNVNPVGIFFALLVGARIAGLLGIFLAVPLAGLVVSLLEIDELQGES